MSNQVPANTNLTIRFRQQLTQHLPQQQDFLIGLSGGVDSVVLLALFCHCRQTQPLRLRAVHIHHGLSPNADFWAAFCQQLCDQWQVPLTVRKVEVCGDHGLEANARHARYHAIGELIQPNEIFATAHHLDDQAETFFLALKRGTGVKGLAAMQAVTKWQNFTIFRPLLTFSKAELLGYAHAEKLRWIEDESNHNGDFDRNFLRNDILPPLNQRWHGFSQLVARASQHCAEQQQLLEELLAEELATRVDLTEQSLNIEGFADFSPLKQQQLVRLWLEKCRQPMPSQVQLQQILHNLIFAEADKNPQVKLGESILRRYRGRVFVTAISFPPTPPSAVLPPQAGAELILPAQLGTIERTADSVIYKKLRYYAAAAQNVEKRTVGAQRLRPCDFKSLSEHNLSFRTPAWRPYQCAENSFVRLLHNVEKSKKCDRLLLPEALRNQPLTILFQPPSKVKRYGKPHREEMKKIWQQHQIPPWLRGKTPLLFWGEELVAVL